MKKRKKILIGGAWPYANNSLHIGHIAALLPGDVLARYYRKTGADVLYVSGTDAHGTPITLRARESQCAPIEIVNHYHQQFTDCFRQLGFSYDNYTLTCTDHHRWFVQDAIKRIFNNGFIFEEEIYQDYCEHCGSFLSDREIEGTCPICHGHAKGDQCDDCLQALTPAQILDKTCKYCGHPVSQRKNRHLYWKLSAFTNELTAFVNERAAFWRTNAINESRKYLRDLPDRAISRQLEWGIDVPISGYADKKIYVWIEAVLGYISAGKAYCEEKGIEWETFYKDPSTISYYVHGKDNIPFHTIIYPALLLSLDQGYQLPQHIISSEYLNVNDEKISKSKGNGITAADLVRNYDPDSVRFTMIFQAPERKDSNFTCDQLVSNHNKHLVGEFGNFVHRNLAYLKKKFAGILPDAPVDPEVKAKIEKAYEEVGELIERGELKAALHFITDLVKFANKYYDDKKPWITAKEDPDDFNRTTATCLSLIANLANLYEPFIPFASKKVFDFFKLQNPSWEYIDIDSSVKLESVNVLFNRIL